MSQQNVEIVRRTIELVNRRDFDALDDFATVDYEWHNAPDFRGGGVHRGRDAANSSTCGSGLFRAGRRGRRSSGEAGHSICASSSCERSKYPTGSRWSSSVRLAVGPSRSVVAISRYEKPARPDSRNPAFLTKSSARSGVPRALSVSKMTCA
jgi:hypothetical protein